jgi:hypothetical protein
MPLPDATFLTIGHNWSQSTIGHNWSRLVIRSVPVWWRSPMPRPSLAPQWLPSPPSLSGTYPSTPSRGSFPGNSCQLQIFPFPPLIPLAVAAADLRSWRPSPLPPPPPPWFAPQAADWQIRGGLFQIWREVDNNNTNNYSNNNTDDTNRHAYAGQIESFYTSKSPTRYSPTKALGYKWGGSH